MEGNYEPVTESELQLRLKDEKTLEFEYEVSILQHIYIQIQDRSNIDCHQLLMLPAHSRKRFQNFFDFDHPYRLAIEDNDISETVWMRDSPSQFAVSD